MKTICTRHTRFQAGMTLIEASVWFVLFALVIAGALKVYSSVSTSQTASAISTDVSGIRSGAQVLFNGTDGYGSISGASLNNAMVTANKIPSSIKIDTTTTPYTMTNEQNGGVSVFQNTQSSFGIAESNISDSVCVIVATNAASQGFPLLQLNGFFFYPGSSLKPSDAALRCNYNSNNNTGNTLRFYSN